MSQAIDASPKFLENILKNDASEGPSKAKNGSQK